MPTFLFWNVAGSSIQSLLSALATANSVDLIVLAECKITPAMLLVSLNHEKPMYQYAPGYCQHLTFLTRFSARFLTPVYESARISIRKLNLPARKEILIAAAHLPSRLHFSESSLELECVSFARQVEKQEQALGHRRTVVIGDLNVNPFEKGLIGAEGFHAAMSLDVALRGPRTVQGRTYHFFYNPMWGHFGDQPNKPPGTYYYEKAEPVNYFWNIFDQVLLRPELLQNFSPNQVRVLTRAGPATLADPRGRPDKSKASDHFPLLLELDF